MYCLILTKDSHLDPAISLPEADMINDISIAGGISTAAYQYPNQHQGQRRNVKIAIVGAGLSGIAAVKLFKETFPQGDVDLVIYEKNADVTGTWLENRYPG